VRVAGPHPIHGERPYTQQSRGCGQPGDFMALPFSFLLKNGTRGHDDPRVTDGARSLKDTNAAKIFVREWAKLRYGVFDEFGFGHDLFYPNHYLHKGRVHPTGSTNVPMKGLWVSRSNLECDPVEEDCLFRPTGDNSKVVCSLGLLHDLTNVTRYCTNQELSQRPMSPSKHNVLCEGRSVVDVISSHQDFKRINPKRKANKIVPEIHLFREPTPQYVLVMETSASMDQDEEWKWISKAAQKFIRYDLPVNSNLAIVTFNNDSKVEHPMTEVSGNDARARLADTIPDKYRLSQSARSCVLCALQNVVHKVLAPENLAGTHIILLTRAGTNAKESDAKESDSKGPKTDEEKIIRNYVLDYNLKISAIVLPASQMEKDETHNQDFLSFYDDVAQSMGGRLYAVGGSGSNVMDFYTGINSAFADVLRSDARYPTEMAVEVHRQRQDVSLQDVSRQDVLRHDMSRQDVSRQEVLRDSSELVTRGSFLIDSTLGRDTLFGIYVEDQEEHRIKSITFADSKGVEYGPYTRMSSTFDLVNFKTINFPREQAPPFHAVRTYFSVMWF
jgi:hypothetical protein